MLIRDACASEFPELGEIRVAAYRADGFLSPDSQYAPRLRALGADGLGHVLVAISDPPGSGDGSGAGSAAGPGDADGGRILGTVMLQSSQHGQALENSDEAEIRALAVSPGAQGAGVGKALLTAVIDRAVREGIRHLVLLTQPEMKAAHRLYEEAGFARLPDRDWSPEPGLTLLSYGLLLDRL